MTPPNIHRTMSDWTVLQRSNMKKINNSGPGRSFHLFSSIVLTVLINEDGHPVKVFITNKSQAQWAAANTTSQDAVVFVGCIGQEIFLSKYGFYVSSLGGRVRTSFCMNDE